MNQDIPMHTSQQAQRLKRRVINSYDNWVIVAYCQIRFIIINMRIMDEIEQYIPKRGTVLDVGCGFGLFSLFFASLEKERRFLSFDISELRIQTARKTARRLNLQNRVRFRCRNVLDYEFDRPVDCAYMLDLIHHIPSDIAPEILQKCYDILPPGGILIIKDVDSRPFYKMAFTWLLDKVVDYRAPVHYWSRESLTELLRQKGFTVHIHQLIDIMPYPHVLYICRKPSA